MNIRHIILVIGVAALLAGCGSGAQASEPPSAQQLASKLGCSHERVQAKLQSMEPARKDRTSCHGATIVTFSSTSNRDDYVKFTLAANKEFGVKQAALVGDDFSIFASPAEMNHIKSVVGQGTVRHA